MRSHIVFRTTLISLGIALLLAALFFDKGTALPRAKQAEPIERAQAAATSTPTAVPGMPTPDRLAQPTLPAVPSQADHGAQVYWERCLTCHGDRGQGLTDEFRQTYPPDHQNCWTSKCHGDHPYQDGFTLPKVVPAVIGPQALQKFPNANILHAFVAAAMPYWNPGSLAEADTWSVTAYLLRENGLWDAQGDLSASNAESIPVGPAASPTLVPSPVPAAGPSFPASLIVALILGLGLLAALLFLTRFLSRPR